MPEEKTSLYPKSVSLVGGYALVVRSPWREKMYSPRTVSAACVRGRWKRAKARSVWESILRNCQLKQQQEESEKEWKKESENDDDDGDDDDNEKRLYMAIEE